MKLPLSWLKEYVDLKAEPHDLARRMTLAGVEAESVTVVGGWDNIVVGLVVGVAPHPNADRLRLATVDTGGERHTVVCGAPNVAPGQKVAFASLGARLNAGHTGQPSVLKPARIRGVESRGMVCSERELGLSEEHQGILVLPEDAPVGAPLADYLGDVVFDFAVTPNRPDCLSVLGIAREAAALTGATVREPSLRYPEAGDPIEKLAQVEVHDPDLCPRYIASVVTGVKIGPSPRWMQDRLSAAGMRSINNIVDITNYVMLEYGQPLHAFDYDMLGGRRIVVRRARPSEVMATIDGQQRKLAPDMLVIADAARPVALAGVMGGADSEVSDRTVNVLLESASFSPASIRATSRAMGLRSEASLRFEKGLSPELPLPAARRATQLMVELAGGTAAEGMADVYPGRQPRKGLRLTAERARRVLGVDVSAGELAGPLEALGFEVERDGDDALEVAVPYWRTDIAIEDDLIEEVVRVKGYDWVPMATMGGRLPSYEPQPMLALKEAVRDVLVAAGMDEIVTYSLTRRGEGATESAPAPLRVANPMSAELEELRTSLRPGLLRTLAANQRNQESGVRLFEVGRVYIPRHQDLPEEREMLAGVLSGPRGAISWQSDAGDLGFFDGKGILETVLAGLGVEAAFQPAAETMLDPGRAARITSGGETLGLLGEVQPSAAAAFDLLARPVVYFEMALDRLLALVGRRPRAYQAIPRFPGLVRDLALVVDSSVPAQRVAEIIRGTPLVREATLFDLYTGEKLGAGKKSLAFRVVYQSPGRTLTAEEADKTQQRLLERLRKEMGATLRA